MKKTVTFFLLSFVFLSKISAQSVEFSPSGPINLKLGLKYSNLSPTAPENKLLVYNRNVGQSGITLIDSASDGSTNISTVYSKAGNLPNQGYFIGNLSSSPLVLFNTNSTKSLYLTPNGNVGIGGSIYGLNNSQKIYAKLYINGFGDSLYSFKSMLPASLGVFSDARGHLNPNAVRIGLAGQTDGLGEFNQNITNIGILGSASEIDTSHANGIGVNALSLVKTEGFSTGLFSKSINLASGTSYGVNLESKSEGGTTYGVASTTNGFFTNYGFYSNLVTKSESVSPSYGFYSNVQNASNNNAVYGFYANVSKMTGASTAYGYRSEVNTGEGIMAVGTYSRANSLNAPSFGTFNNAVGNSSNYGVYGFADGGTQNFAIYGILGETPNENDYAGYFKGNVHINGVLSKSSGTFKIDHPQDPANKTLSHSFVESPEMMNIYNGNIITDAQGNAEVSLPSYFEHLNENFRYQLTVIGKFSQAIIAEKIKGNMFKIKTSEPNTEVSWLVTGTRKDAFAKQNPIIVEQEKSPENKGKYLNPNSFGKTSKEAMFRVPNSN